MKRILLRTLKIMLIFLAGAAARFAAIAITVFVLVYKLSIADLLFFPVMAVVIALEIYAGFFVGRISEKKLRLPRMAGVGAYAFGAAVLLSVLIIRNEQSIELAKSSSSFMFGNLGVAVGVAFRWILWGNVLAVAANAAVQAVYTIVRKKDENNSL